MAITQNRRLCPTDAFFYLFIKRVAVSSDFLKASAAAALQQCESCSQKRPIFFRELSMCSRNSQRTTNHFRFECETNQPQPGDMIHCSGRHQVGHVHFLLEYNPEKEKQMFKSSFSCHPGLVIPKQTPRSCMVRRQYCNCQE